MIYIKCIFIHRGRNCHGFSCSSLLDHLEYTFFSLKNKLIFVEQKHINFLYE